MNGFGAIPPELEEKVERELESGERIVWMEQPIPRYFTAMSTGAFLFAIPWTAFAVFWICGASGFKVPDFSKGGFSFFPLFGVPFVLIGLGMLSSPFWARRKALKTVYVITDRRAITIDGGWTTTIRSYPPERLQNVCRKEKRDGTGDVILAERVWSGTEGRQQTQDLGFLNISDPKTVEQMLRKLAEQAGQVGK
jgi:hypothetical protein